MAFSDWEKAMYAYIVGRTLPKGTTRMAAKATLAAAVQAGRAISPYAARAAPPLARAAVNPYVGVPLAAATGTYMLQEELERSGFQEEVNVARDQAIAAILEQGPEVSRKTKKRVRSTYNRAVSKAMKAVKASAKAGPKGTITNARKTFGQVSRAVSGAKKGRKLGKTGVTGVVKRAIAGMFKPKPKRRTSSKGSYTITTRKS